MKAATRTIIIFGLTCKISIHAAREGGDYGEKALDASCRISIHAAREGGDNGEPPSQYNGLQISIHAAREGGDDKNLVLCVLCH